MWHPETSNSRSASDYNNVLVVILCEFESNYTKKISINDQTVQNTVQDSSFKPLQNQYQTTTTSDYQKFAPINITKLPQTAQKQHQT